METRRTLWKELLAPVAFALVCIVVLGLSFRQFGGHLPLEARGYRVTVPLTDAAGLVAGSDVRTAGVKIGRVVAVRQHGAVARTTIELRSKYAPIRANASAIPRTKTLLGEAFLELTPGPPTAAPLPDNGYLAASQVRSSVRLDEFLGTFDVATRQRIRTVFRGMSKALDGRADELSGSLAHSAPASVGFNDLLGALDEQRPQLARLINRSAGLLGAVGRRSGDLTGTIRAADQLLSVTAEHQRDLKAVVGEAAPFLVALRSTSRSITSASPDLRAATTALSGVARDLRPALDALASAAPDYAKTFERLPAAVDAAHRGLPAVNRMLPSARKALSEFYPTARELIPFMQLLSANRTVPPSILANLGSALNGAYAGPGGKIMHYGVALPTVWNELVAGWKRKLPTSRPFPYPKPGAMDDLAKLGLLKSYDCRHTGNRLWLPPTGSGAMPCVVQGPWTFNGRTAYYPRLLQSPP